MARLERLTAKVFADSAPADEIGQFGSALLGTKVLTSDVATIQGLSAYNNGWGSAVISNRNYPTMQEFNGILKVMSYQTAYQMQEGIPEYDSSTTYFKGSVVKVNISGTVQVPDGQGGFMLTSSTDVHFYASLVDNNRGYAVTNTNYWIELKYVKTTGDTMTGRLSINLSDLNSTQQSAYIVRDTSVEFGTPPSSNMYDGMLVIADSNNNRMGRLEYVLNSDGSHYLSLVDKKNSSESDYSYIRVGFDANGNKKCSFPDTTCVDGQWQSRLITIATGVNISSGSNVTYDLTSSIPKDGYCYELLLWARAITTTTANHYIPIYVGSSLTAGSYLPVCGMKAVNNVSNTSIGSTILPLGTDRKITLSRDAGYHGTLEELGVRAIRRVGTNS